MIQRFLTIIALIALLAGCATPAARPVAPSADSPPPVPAQPLASAAPNAAAPEPVLTPTPAPAMAGASHEHSAPAVPTEETPAKLVPQPIRTAESKTASKPAAPATPKQAPRDAKPKPTTAVTKPAAVVPPAPPKAAAANLNGRLQLLAGARQQIAPGEVADGLVYFLPKSGGSKPKPGRYSIATQSKGFTPNLLVVPVGSTVAFPNKDTILHNVFSRTPGSAFNLDTYAPGESRQVVLSTPGLVIVNCNVHHNMRANIVVLSTPYYTRPNKDGSFRLDNLPPGPGTLVFWHPRSNAVTQPVNAGTSAAIAKQLTASKPRLDAHLLMGH